ncbi:hypothetical protein J2W28_001606 [Variovorax boronicumulans]|uniref:hypothetical protein n=1 Tax=Variovorax boronicumulans TaxID=436515 RepID=UPI0027891080|nr:hypothetical protein [Variovorax boronicumulans]MDP9992362.1 hypothetical protein [Variovorax boronicumulans]MDQ0002466.1 hypothetical protein [Variovorax boronicumulans]
MPRPFPAASAGAGVPESRGARHAALLLHAMSPQDRSWMLESLPAAERAGLVPLLAELEALGIERDPTLIEDATSGASAAVMPEQDFAAVASHPLSDEAMLRALDGSQVRELVACLRTEPVGLIAEWLRLADWPWREDFLSALELGQRRRIEASLSATASGFETPPGLRAALITAVAARLREQQPAAEAPAAAPWHRLTRSFRQVFRGASSRRSWRR